MERRMNKLVKYILECEFHFFTHRKLLEKYFWGSGLDKTDVANMVVPEFNNPKVPLPLPGEDLDADDDETEDDQAQPMQANAPDLTNNGAVDHHRDRDHHDDQQHGQQQQLTNDEQQQQQIPAPAG
jgi:hypothetical protein